MGEVSDSGRRGACVGRLVALAAAAAVALAAGGCDRQAARAAGEAAQAPLAEPGLVRFASGAMKNLAPSPAGVLAPAIPFTDVDGKPVELSKFKGKVVLVNLWATWCGPCVTEMPTLAALQARYKDKGLVVLPISVDRKSSVADVKSFIGVHPPLIQYDDFDFAIPMKLKVLGLPTTIIYDREGREVARVKGEAKWDSPEATRLVDHLLAQG